MEPARDNRENGEKPLQPRYCNGLRKLRLIFFRENQKTTVPTISGWEGVTSRLDALSQETYH